VDVKALTRIAGLLAKRNAIDEEIGRIMNRPMVSGHLGEWIASQVFDIELEAIAVNPGFDGRFRGGALAERTVNVKWYLKREGLLDTSESMLLDYYLVLAGPPSVAVSSQGHRRPWCIAAVYLFDARRLRSEQIARGVKQGVASSVTRQQWAAAEIYPVSCNPAFAVTAQQAEMLALLRPE
jgi:hypothetical protein